MGRTQGSWALSVSVARTRRGNEETKRCADQDAGGESRSRIAGDVVVCNSGVVSHLRGRALALIGQCGFRFGHGCFDLGPQLV